METYDNKEFNDLVRTIRRIAEEELIQTIKETRHELELIKSGKIGKDLNCTELEEA